MPETTLLSLRHTRLIYFGHYLVWFILWILAVVAYVNPYGVIPGYPAPLVGIQVKTILAWLLGFVGFVELVVVEVRRRMTRYLVTDNRIIRTDGIVRRRTMEIPYTQIERVELEQGLLQRILGFGDLVLDTGEDTETLQSLRHVKLVHDEVIKHIGQMSYRPPSER